MQTSDREPSEAVLVCPRTGKVIGPRPVSRWTRWLLPISGLVCLAWFLVRVIPKPSRALYPCQRMAFPVASGFIAWLVGMATMIVAFRQARHFGKQRRALIAAVCLAVAVAAGLHTLFNAPAQPAVAGTDLPNAPMGVAKGVNPGRVVWAHDPNATDFRGNGTGDGHWWEARHHDQAAIDKMLSASLRKLTGTNSDEAAWDAIFKYYNNSHGRPNTGYTAGDKINIKLNLVASNDMPTWMGWGWVNYTTYVQTAGVDNVSVSPWMALALLRQLVYKAGVPQQDISIGDPICLFVSQYWDACHEEFGNVKYLDHVGNSGRTKAVKSTTHRFYWSNNGDVGKTPDYVPQACADARYFINFAYIKWHEGGGVSLCGKNYYGILRNPGGYDPADPGYYDLHSNLPYWPGAADATPNMNQYRTLTDLMAHSDFGYGKGILWLLDGLWGGRDAGTEPIRWDIPPFNYDWPSSLVVSQDPVAIDSVGLDACKADAAVNTTITNPSKRYPIKNTAADDYLHEAALINDPPSHTFYDPDHRPPSVRRPSLGVHEHWNNGTDRKYSRNLGTGNGIELLWLETGKAGDINFDSFVNVGDLQALVMTWGSGVGQPSHNPDADLNNDGYVNVGDLQILVQHWGS